MNSKHLTAVLQYALDQIKTSEIDVLGDDLTLEEQISILTMAIERIQMLDNTDDHASFEDRIDLKIMKESSVYQLLEGFILFNYKIKDLTGKALHEALTCHNIADFTENELQEELDIIRDIHQDMLDELDAD